MDCSVPTSDVIPAVAARLKYYLDVERKEAGFDLSNQKNSNKKYRLYQLAGSHAQHQTQGPKKYFLENKIEASLQSCTGKSGAEWNQKVKINQERKRQVQRKLRKKMSSLAIPDRLSSNRVHLRSIKCSDLKNYSAGLSHSSPPDVSHGEFRRLVTSAASLIVATTPGCPLQRSPKCRTETGLKTAVIQSHLSPCVNIPTSWQEDSSCTETLYLGEGSHTGCDEHVDVGLTNNQTVPASTEKIVYDIVINIGASSPKEAKPSLIIRLVGENGRSLFLQTFLVNTTRSCAGQAVTCHARDVGELKHVIIGVDRPQKDCRCYCRSITVKKGTTDYVFPCNKWLCPFRTVVAHATELVHAANVLPATAAKVSDNCQTRKKEIIPSTGDSKLHCCRDTSPLITSTELEISSCKQVGSAVKVNPNKLVVCKINVDKSVASHIRAEREESQRTAVRNHAALERKPLQASSCGMGAPLVPSGNNGGTSNNVSDQVTMVVEPPYKPIIEDGGIQQSPLGENNLDHNVTTKTTSTDGNLPVQNKLQTDGVTTPNYGKASSPASYDNKETPVIVEVNKHARKNTSNGLFNVDPREIIRASSEGMNQSPRYLLTDSTKEEFEDRALQLLLLQQGLSESVDSLSASSPRADSQPFSNCSNNAEATVDPGATADEDNEIHTQTHGYTGSRCQLDSEAAQTSDYCCSCGDCCSYVSDSTLDEDFLFYDTSLELSLSEDEDSETPLKSSHLVKGAKDNNEEYNMRVCYGTFMNKFFRRWPDEDYLRYTKEGNKEMNREVRVDFCSENMNIFTSALAAIRSHDSIKLRNVCQSHFFIPSFTDEECKTLLHHAASQEDPIICEVLLDTNVGKVNIDQKDKFGKTALHYAIQNENTKTIKLLLDNGAKQ